MDLRHLFGWMLASGVAMGVALPAMSAPPTQPASRPAPQLPDLGPNVLIIHPDDAAAQEKVNAVFAVQEAAQFGPGRHAILFMPGKYDLDVQVGFYTQVAGLGMTPDAVAIRGAVRSKAKWMKGNATCNFWRAAENLAVTPTLDNNANVWAVSQGTSFRRMHVRGDMILSDGGWSSGGLLADCVIDGGVNSGSQQQWLSRNVTWDGWFGGSWNMVFVGCPRPPKGTWPEKPYTVVERTPIIREKPYLAVDKAGRLVVMLPPLRKDAAGHSWGGGGAKALPIEQFYIAKTSDTAATINAALAAGKHLLLTPGVYELDAPIRVERAGTVVLGLGYPTLAATAATVAMTVADVDGVTLAGVLLEARMPPAGKAPSPTLLEVGPAGASAADHSAAPTLLVDVYARSGGAVAGQAEAYITINSRHVIADNLWLWRADHGAGVGWQTNTTATGLVVNGDDVTIYGLFVEHCQKYQTVWNGENGRTYFYQSEMPYDPPSQQAWMNGQRRGYASYKVADHVKRHEAIGLGVYAYFNVAPVVAHTAIEAPADVPGVNLSHLVSIRLPGKPGSGIAHVLNDQGPAVLDQMKATWK